MAEKSVLLIVDVQMDFCPGGSFPVEGGDEVVPVINRYVALFRDLNLPIIASRDWHPPESSHFKGHGGSWPAHCVQGTTGAGFHPELKLPRSAVIISKGIYVEEEGYSAFDGYDADGRRLDEFFARFSVDAIYLAGLATDYCVKATALEALKRAYKVFLLEDAVKGVDKNKGDSDRSVAEMVNAGARPVKIKEVMDILSNPADTVW
ncbi:MAG: nicotinamidase [Deltaproteobacteria bacterium]